jgi:hypothetical protein
MSDPEEDRNSNDSDSIEEEGLGKLQGPSLSQMLSKSDTHFSTHFHKPWPHQVWFG